jgi:hypothetical protein
MFQTAKARSPARNIHFKVQTCSPEQLRTDFETKTLLLSISTVKLSPLQVYHISTERLVLNGFLLFEATVTLLEEGTHAEVDTKHKL